jgi:hypothetical protein
MIDDGARFEQTIYDVDVPPYTGRVQEDTPIAYRVTLPETDTCRCIVYGMYQGQWYANPSCRWLIRHLLESVTEAKKTIDRLEQENRELQETDQ